MKEIVLLWFLTNLFSVIADEATLTRSVEAAPLFLKVIGDFDPKAQDVYFISALRATFDEYYQLYVDDVIYGFDIAATFFYNITQYVLDVFDNTILITSWCEVRSAFSIPTDSNQSSFTEGMASKLLVEFFSASYQSKLIGQLRDNSNITIDSIGVFSASNDEVKTVLNVFANTNPDDASSDSFKETSKSQFIISTLSGVIISLAIVALSVSFLRRRYYIGKIESGRAPDCLPDSKLSKASSKDLIRNDVSEDTKSEHDGENSIIKPSVSTNDSRTVLTLTRVVGGVDEIEQYDPSVLIDSDTTESVDTLFAETTEMSRNHVYSDTQCNSSLPSNPDSPVWSLDGYSNNTSPYSSHGEFSTRRLRWHDEVNDLDLLALPGSCSPCSSTIHSSSSATQESVYTSKKAGDQ
jgi:hypothetical protein